MWRVARACPRECVAPRATEAKAVTDSRSPLQLRPPQGVERESPPECRDPWRVEDKRFLSKNRGHYDGRARRARPAGLPHTPPQVSGVGVPHGTLEAGSFSVALRDSLDAFTSPLHERLSFMETALEAYRLSRRRRRRLSSSSLDGEYSGGDGGRHVPRRAVARALGRELKGVPHRRFSRRSSLRMIMRQRFWIVYRTPWRIRTFGMSGRWHTA